MQIEGVKYTLKQMHWHSPSEHTINGQRFAMEQHMVHYSDQGDIAVVAILFRLGRPEPFLMQVVIEPLILLHVLRLFIALFVCG